MPSTTLKGAANLLVMPNVEAANISYTIDDDSKPRPQLRADFSTLSIAPDVIEITTRPANISVRAFVRSLFDTGLLGFIRQVDLQPTNRRLVYFVVIADN